MSFLYPLLLAGVAAVVLPIVLHLIRRHTRVRVTFSSLLFLRTTAPRYRHRSRLEHIPLLLVRCLVIGLLAFAFARPFLVRSTASTSVRPDQRIVLLVDVSASMRREGLWARALEEAGTILNDVGPSDRVCLMTFDRDVHRLMGFERWASTEPATRAALGLRELSQRSPGWGGTDLGLALVAAAEALEDDEANDQRQSRRRVVLISDLQEGGNLDALRAYEWPAQTQLAVRAIPCPGSTNASLQWLADRRSPFVSRQDTPKVRVTNSAGAAKEQFQLVRAVGTDSGTDVYVPPGHGAVMPLPAGPNVPETTQLTLRGDDHDFDNVLYVAPPAPASLHVLYLGGDEANDTSAMLYYLRQALGADRTTAARVIQRTGTQSLSPEDMEAAQVIVVTGLPSPANTVALRRYLEAGGTILLVLASPEAGPVLSGLAGIGDIACEEAPAGGYAMFGRLEFEHSLLQPFADPRFSDFTRIHFWRHRRIDLAACPGARVLAWFDNDDPAWLELTVGQGSLLVWTSGWQPSDSDLALSSKFVPLLYLVLQYAGALTDRPSQYFVGDPVPVSRRGPSAAAGLQVRKPDGSTVRLDAGQHTFTQTDLPGIYLISDSAGAAQPQSFAVNLPVAESRTDPLALEDLERLGVSLESASDVHQPSLEAAMYHRDLREIEMESDQKLWRWVLATALGVLLLETWLSGRLARSRLISEGEQK